MKTNTKRKHEIAQKRYYLHRMLKSKYPIDPDKRTIDVPYSKFEDIPTGDRYYIGQLIKLRYSIQLKLL